MRHLVTVTLMPPVGELQHAGTTIPLKVTLSGEQLWLEFGSPVWLATQLSEKLQSMTQVGIPANIEQ
jgi:hypothetical protein